MPANKLPTVSVVIPTYNSELVLGPCLDSIFKQKYPKDKMQVIVVDSQKTTDSTRKIAANYPVLILNNPKFLAEPGKTLGIKHSTGEMFFYLDSDAELVSDKWILDMVKPLIKDSSLAGSFTRFIPKASQTPFNRYISYNPLQLWSMLAFVLPSIRSVTTEHHQGYDVIKINPRHTIPIGMGVYRKKWLDQVVKDPDKFNYVDIAIPIHLAELGHDLFAYVPSAGFYHISENLWHQARRLKRDVVVTYLPVVGERKFHYIDFKKPSELLKIVIWVIYVNLLFPSLLVGLYKIIKYHDWAGMYELPVNFILTNYTILLFLKEKNGRELLKNILLRRSVTSVKSRQIDYEAGSKYSL